MEALAELNAPLSDNLSKETNKKPACVFLMMIICAGLGWIAENTVKLISSGIMDNRFHVLPFIFPYGFAFLAMQFFLGDTDDLSFFGKRIFKKKNFKTAIASNVIYVTTVCFFVFIGELAVGNLYELATGASLWDYSSQPLHLTKYVCLSSALGYGVGAYIIMKVFYYPVLNALLSKGNIKAVKIVDCTLGVAVVLDSVCMILITLITKVPPIYWTIKI